MARSLAQIKQQIAKLHDEAHAIEDKERVDVIKRIQAAMAHYSLTADDLLAARPKRGRPRKDAAKTIAPSRSAVGRSARKGKKVPPKFGDGSGNTWTGRGNRPRWLVAALAEGKTMDQFAL